MTGVLHPIGPEPERTYWLRRVVLLAVVVLLIGGLIAVAGALGRGSDPAAGSPADSPGPSEPVASTATPTPTTTPRSTPSASSTSSPTASPSTSTSSAERPTEKATEKASEKSGEKSNQKSSQKTPTTAPTTAAPSLCSPGVLSARLAGDRTLTVDQDTTFTVSMTNTGGTTCTLAVAPSTFELKIYSGTDRIWSTADCASAVRSRAAILKAGQTMTWKQGWSGQRSAASCKQGTSMPRPGVYWATAQYTGAKPTQLRMLIG